MTKKRLVLSLVLTFSFVFSLFMHTKSTVYCDDPPCSYVESSVKYTYFISGNLCSGQWTFYYRDTCCTSCKKAGGGSEPGVDNGCSTQNETFPHLVIWQNGQMEGPVTKCKSSENYYRCKNGTDSGEAIDIVISNAILNPGEMCAVECEEE